VKVWFMAFGKRVGGQELFSLIGVYLQGVLKEEKKEKRKDEKMKKNILKLVFSRLKRDRGKDYKGGLRVIRRWDGRDGGGMGGDPYTMERF